MNEPALKVQGSDPRGKMYARIAEVHKQITEAKWKSRTTNTPFQVNPNILLHLEESVAFLAEEQLKIQVAFEDLAEVESGKEPLEEKAQT